MFSKFKKSTYYSILKKNKCSFSGECINKNISIKWPYELKLVNLCQKQLELKKNIFLNTELNFYQDYHELIIKSHVLKIDETIKYELNFIVNELMIYNDNETYNKNEFIPLELSFDEAWGVPYDSEVHSYKQCIINDYKFSFITDSFYNKVLSNLINNFKLTNTIKFIPFDKSDIYTFRYLKKINTLISEQQYYETLAKCLKC